MDCSKCKLKLKPEELLKCNACSITLHYTCAGLDMAGFKKILPMNKPKWKCANCKPSKLGSPIVFNKVCEESEEMSSIINIDTESLISLINRRFDSLKDSIDTFKTEVNARLTQLSDTVSSFDQRISSAEARIESLSETTMKLASENISLSNAVDLLKMELSDREQEFLCNDVEISGITETKEENVGHIVQVLANKLGLSINECDIVSATRVGVFRPGGLVENVSGKGSNVAAEPRPRPIAVRFARRSVKDGIINAARVRRGATTADCDLPGPSRRFYVNERLTRTNRWLFNKAREEGKRHGWRFIWTKEGKVLVRKEQGKASHRIRSEMDLASVFGSDKVGTNVPRPSTTNY
ncbi:hypothetical protein JYU34_002181 [Plutella xylostella]|uniref:Zinc finger PHD-type domain-containing protein n=2 Tax=Plutella xylostella TaxID=51655 RepID=A0ABQ7R1M2_PLUXY|nr:hypothetical protein JYU34_002181 [Plutella xylostella]